MDYLCETPAITGIFTLKPVLFFEDLSCGQACVTCPNLNPYKTSN